MSITPISLSTGYADLEIYNGYETFGFRLATGAPVTEKRGDGFAGQVASGGQNYDDATPFKRKVYDNFLGGFGQVSDNKVSGGVGIGGDDTKFFYADAMTDRAGYLMPGMARNFIYNTYASAKLPVAGDANPLPGDEYEVPRGVLPSALTSNRLTYSNTFTVGTSALNGITNIRLLLEVLDATINTTVTLNCEIWTTPTTLVRTFTATYNPSTYNLNGWAWFTLSAAATNFLANTTYTLNVYATNTPGTYVRPLGSLGCYVQTTSTVTRNSAAQSDWDLANRIKPYFQICKPGTATPYKYWSGPLRKVHQVLNGSAYVNVAVCSTAWFNVAATATGGTAANNPEVTLTGVWTGSLVLNNKLYIATSNNLSAWSAGLLAVNSNAAPTNGPDVGGAGISSLIQGYGNIYFVTNGGLGISKWSGTFPFAATVVVQPGTIGDPGTAITKIFFYQGNLWAIKPEGVFCLYGDPSILGTTATNTPRILPMGDPFPTPHQSAGSYATLHQGSIYINYKERLFQFTVSAAGTQVQVIPLPMPWYRLGNYHQVDGIASDGINLYVSYNNLGVFKYINQTWHVVTEYYETINTEPTNCGLTWMPNPTGALDNLYFRDSFSLVQVPMPNAASPYTRQVTLADQNKCGYLITSATNMDAAEMNKYVFSMVLACFMSSYCVMVRPVVYVPGSTDQYQFANINTVLQQSFQLGLTRDRWMNPRIPVDDPLVPGGNPKPGAMVAANPYSTDGLNTYSIASAVTSHFASYGPTFWTPYDFQGSSYSSEKPSYITWTQFAGNALPYDDLLQNPANFVQTAFIVYFFDPFGGQQSTTNLDPFVIDSLVAKYQTTQNYVALYKFALATNLLTDGRGSNMTPVEAEDVWEWLRVQFTRHAPVQITIKVRNVVDSNIATTGLQNIIPNQNNRVIVGFLQNPTDQYGNPVVMTDTNQPLPERLDFEFISIFGENNGL